MTEQNEQMWYSDRCKLCRLRQQHPDWSYRQLAEATGRSLRWVKRWCRRFKEADLDDDQVLKGFSRRPKNIHYIVTPAVTEAILALRDNPQLHYRTPGPVAILAELRARYGRLEDGRYRLPNGDPLPTSTATVYHILKCNGRIQPRSSPNRDPLPRAQPMEAWQIDFKVLFLPPTDPDATKADIVKVLNIVDEGTSILIANPARDDFHAETVIEELAQVFEFSGCPDQITFDRDPCFVGSPQSSDFPSALQRFLHCLDITPIIVTPSRNCYVERFNRTLEEEYIATEQPETLKQVKDMNANARHHYNYVRPNQALSCGNQPPRLAAETLPPKRTPAEMIDPDSWLLKMDGHTFRRRVNTNGSIQVDKKYYYVGRAYRGQQVEVRIDAAVKEFVVEANGGEVVKRAAIKGLHGAPMKFADYVTFIKEQARSEWRRYLLRQKARRAHRQAG